MYGLLKQSRDGPSVAVAGFRGQARSKGILPESSLCLLSSRLVSVLALFVESWQQQLYPQFPSDSYFSHETSGKLILLGTFDLTGVRSVPLGECSMLGCLRPQPKTCGLRGMEFPHSNI